MQNPDWQDEFNRYIEQIRQSSGSARIVIMGVGNELSADDAAGVLIVRKVRSLLGTRPDLLLLEAGVAPENTTGIIRKFSPDLVIIVDAAQMNEKSGAVRWLSLDKLDGVSSFTHTLPLKILANYLVREIRCKVCLLGIQPETIEFDYPLSSNVKVSIEAVVSQLTSIL